WNEAARTTATAGARDELEHAPDAERRGIADVERAPRRPRVTANRSRGADGVVDGNEMKRRVSASRERQREIGWRRHDEQDEKVGAVEPIDLAGLRVADDDGGPHDCDRKLLAFRGGAHHTLALGNRLFDRVPEGLALVELVFE